MLDLSKTIEAKSDQLNADDLITGAKLIKITDVKLVSAQQDLEIHYEGGDGKPWKPCKGMKRLMVFVWGKDGEKFIGESILLYREASVVYAGREQGGIRIKEMSGLKKPITFPLTIAKGKKIMIGVHPLKVVTKEKPVEKKPEAELTPEQQEVKQLLCEMEKPKTFLDFSKATKQAIGRHEEDLSKLTIEECAKACEFILNCQKEAN